jgi:ectoine hydroxylase-related dioxygenase (phytanoyl-CoA dioxygenase family)
MSIQHFPSTATGEEIGDALRRDGAAIIDRLVSPAVMDRVRDEIDPYVSATRIGTDNFAGRNTKRTGALIARSPMSRDLVMHSTALTAVRNLLAHATNFQLHLTQVISIGPGEPMQLIHRDQWAFDFFPFPSGYEVQCNTIWAMTDFTEENGATRLVPGSNHREDRLSFAEADTVPAEMEKGSVLLYTGSVYHGGGANRSAAVRSGINITYNVAWLRQEENQYLSVPHDIARELPVELLRLMGYARGAYALGYVDDLRDPIEVLRPDLAKEGLGDLESVSRALGNAAARS